MHSGIGWIARTVRVTTKIHNTGLRYIRWPIDLGAGSGSFIDGYSGSAKYSRPRLLQNPRRRKWSVRSTSRPREIDRRCLRLNPPRGFPQISTEINLPPVTNNLDRGYGKRTMESWHQAGTNSKRGSQAESAPLTPYSTIFYPEVLSIQDFTRSRADLSPQPQQNQHFAPRA